MTDDLLLTAPAIRPQRATATTSRTLSRITRLIPVVVIGIYVFTAVLGPLLIDFDPVSTNIIDRLLPPGATTSTGQVALLGTDGTGRDMLGQLVYGARTSMLIGTLTVAACAVVGVIVGLIAGYLGGAADTILSRIVDILIAFPSIVLAIVVAGLFERGIVVVVVALSLAGWVSFARLTRGAALSLREREWVSSARTMGVPTPKVMARHVLPFVVAPVVALVALEFGLIVLGEAGLSFLGIGLPHDVVSWGQTIAAGKAYLSTAWWISVFPGIALALLVVMTGLLGDQLNSRYQRGGSR
ncbi:MAG: ABC transporter permease [Protaetiibacter sp.]